MLHSFAGVLFKETIALRMPTARTKLRMTNLNGTYEGCSEIIQTTRIFPLLSDELGWQMA